MKKSYVYTGGYTLPTRMGSGETVPAACPGILCFRWDERAGSLEKISVEESAVNPSWILCDPNEPYLYCVSELKTYAEIGGSTVSAYRIDPENGSLTLLNRQSTGGTDACHLMLSPNGKYLVASNYSGGSVCVLPIREDHSLAEMCCLFRHPGKGTNPQRQEQAHAHQALLSPDEQVLFVSDLGLDRMVCYAADWETGLLRPLPQGDIPCLPGQGARHALFHTDGELLYQMTEMACEVNVYRYNRKTMSAQRIQTISAMEDGRPAEGSLGAAIHLHPSSKWLYVSVRGTNSDYDRIVVFDRREDGTLSRKQMIYAGGKIPRDFTISEDGAWLLCGLADSNRIVVFSIDPDTGMLQEHFHTDEAGGVTRVAMISFS